MQGAYKMKKSISRTHYLEDITQSYRITPICAILGPRQCGKTFIAKEYAKALKEKVIFFDLEDPDHLNALDNPKLALDPLKGLIVIDEIQKRPDLFPILRVLVDQHQDRQFLILGSASQELIRQSSESLAGRINYIELTPFRLTEIEDFYGLWVKGGFPLSYLADTDQDSMGWRKAYIRTYLEKDIPQLELGLDAQLMRKLWIMLSHYNGNIFNASELGRSLDTTHKTIKKYLNILEGTFMVRSLQPWFSNIQKRQVKSPKIYLRDSGLLHALLNIESLEQLLVSPKIGSSWEGFAMEEIISFHQAYPEDCFFWATHSGAELDLLITQGMDKKAFEFKYSNTPKVTPSMLEALDTLELEKIYVIVPGKQDYLIHEKIQVIGLETYLASQTV